MRYLKLTIQRNRRRIQIEQLLLLLLRIALPVLLFLFLARPLLNPTGLERWLGGAGRVSHVVLVDDSLSMGYASGGPPAFHRAREVAGTHAGGGPAGRPLHARRRPRPRGRRSSTRSKGPAARSCRATPWRCRRPRPTPSWPTVLEGVDEVVQSCTYPTRELTIITDLRKAGWDAGVSRDWPGAGPSKGCASGSWTWARTRPAMSPWSRSSPLDRTILAGAESRWEAVIRNDSPRVLAGAKAVLRVDDRPTEVDLPEIAPRAVGDGPADRPVPGQRAARPLAPAPRRRTAGRQPALGGRAGEGFAPDPPGRRRAVVGAVRLGGRLPRRSAVDRRRRRRGLARRGRSRRTTSSPPGSSRPTSWSWPTSRPRRPSRRAGSAGLVRGGMGLMIFTGAKLDVGALQRPALSVGSELLLPCSLKAPGRRRDHGACSSSRSDRRRSRSCWTEAIGPRAGDGPPDHGGGRGCRGRRRSGCSPAGTTRRGRPR